MSALACWRKSGISKCRRSVESDMGPEIDQRLWWGARLREENGEARLGNRIPCAASPIRQKRPSDRRWGALADEVLAPRQQREQLEPEIGNKESSECDRWNAHKRIPD